MTRPRSRHASLPESLNAGGWADFHTAWALAHAGNPKAMALLAMARARFGAEHDERGVMLSAAALIVTGQTEGDFRHVESAIADLAPLRDGAGGLADRDEELLALSGLLLGLLFWYPRDPFIATCVERVMRLLESTADADLLHVAARVVMFHVEATERRELGQRLNALVEARAGDPAPTPLRRAQWLTQWRVGARYGKQALQAQRALSELRALADRHGLTSIHFKLAVEDFEASLPSADAAAAQASLGRVEALADPARLNDQMVVEWSRSRLAQCRGDADSALLHASRVRRLAVELHAPPLRRAVAIVNEALARLAAGDYSGARDQMHQALPLVPPGFAQEIGEMTDAVAAYEAVLTSRPDARRQLAQVWQRLRERQFYDSFDGYPAFAAKLCAMALEHGIEVEFVRSVIDKRGLAPPPDAPPSWPWPLRIRTLGGFSVERRGAPLGFKGKTQKKPLALLRAVVAHGAIHDGGGADVPTLIGQLWPDLDASDPRSSFEVTLSRLRKWLGVEGALELVDGRLALNPSLAWCDVTAFERACEALQRRLVLPVDLAAATAIANRLTDLYRGPLFGDVALERWSVGPRERLALRFARSVTDHGHQLETHQRWSDALRLYELALARDVLAEPMYRALIRCHLALGQAAQARGAFERCKAVLAAAYALAPSTDTLALASSIPGDQPTSTPGR